MNKKIPRPNPQNPDIDQLQLRGFGSRSIWPYPPVGEAARRDPNKPDPVPNAGGRGVSYHDLSPEVRHVGDLHAGGGATYNGFPPSINYVKPIGPAMQRSLGRQQISGNIDAMWRLGGISMPFDAWGLGYGFGYQGDSASIWPNNPQTYLRNPGIHPLTNVPPAFRGPTTMNYIASFQSVGPSIGDIGHVPMR